MENILELKTINELQECKFFIPSYQRGYRWSMKEVNDLLNDVSEFRPRQVGDTDEKSWYCLQPIVVKKLPNEQYEVIDGQQRLTSIYLILHYLNQIYTIENRSPLFDLNYQTRNNSSTFLKEFDEKLIISEAYKETIQVHF
jgi:uncharacterized protein with ParB-like and HNH nuclease domain